MLLRKHGPRLLRRDAGRFPCRLEVLQNVRVAPGVAGPLGFLNAFGFVPEVAPMLVERLLIHAVSYAAVSISSNPSGAKSLTCK